MGKEPVTKKKYEKLKNYKLISKYHAINRQISTKGEEGEELDDLGGFDGYQAASLYGAKFANTSKWLLLQLKPFKPVLTENSKKCRLLDVGALAFNYTDIKWIESEAIDLRPLIPGIKKIDFMEFPKEPKKDVVCLSLVINFVGNPVLRGQMFDNAWNVLDTVGFMYVVLPKSTIYRSRYMSNEYFLAILGHYGFTCLQHHTSPKLAYYFCRKSPNKVQLTLKEPNIKANGYNNFKIRVC